MSHVLFATRLQKMLSYFEVPILIFFSVFYMTSSFVHYCGTSYPKIQEMTFLRKYCLCRQSLDNFFSAMEISIEHRMIYYQPIKIRGLSKVLYDIKAGSHYRYLCDPCVFDSRNFGAKDTTQTGDYLHHLSDILNSIFD